MRFLSLFTLLLVPLIAQAPRVDLIHLDPQPAISGGCPARVHFNGRIRANGPLDVTYQWLRSDGSHTEHQLHFARPSTQNIGTDWQLNKTMNGWMQLVILEPSRMQTAKANFSVHCGK
jgi:hypothetical protein